MSVKSLKSLACDTSCANTFSSAGVNSFGDSHAECPPLTEKCKGAQLNKNLPVGCGGLFCAEQTHGSTPTFPQVSAKDCLPCASPAIERFGFVFKSFDLSSRSRWSTFPGIRIEGLIHFSLTYSHWMKATSSRGGGTWRKGHWSVPGAWLR